MSTTVSLRDKVRSLPLVLGRNKYLLVLLVLALIVAVPAGVALTAPRAQVIPTLSIVSVDQDNSVTIRTSNFPANQSFTVLMGPFGTLAINGTVVATTDSGTGGTFDATYQIPDALKGHERIAIRLQSPAGYNAYNWFWNNTTGGATPPPPPTPVPGPIYTGIPTFSVENVVAGDSVTVQTSNFPPARDFVVTIGPYGTRGLGGTVVETISSGVGGSFTATLPIPDTLAGSYRLAIRMQSQTGGYYAYNWFYNNTAGTGTGDGGTGGGEPRTDYQGIPTFSIKSVAADESVIVQTANFPANRDFVVTMAAYGTRGINGIVASTLNSGEGGSFEATIPIPEALDGSYRLAIRMQSQTGGFYAYNWFYNNTTP